jgi:hypothetical protein
VRGQAQGDERGAAGGQAQVQRLVEQRPGLIEPAAADLQDAQLGRMKATLGLDL